jgi:hypothetical protein
MSGSASVGDVGVPGDCRATVALGRTRPAGLLGAFTTGCAGQAPVGVWRCLRRHGLSTRCAGLPRGSAMRLGTSCRMQEQEREQRHRCAAGRAGSSGVENTMMKRVVERVGLR